MHAEHILEMDIMYIIIENISQFRGGCVFLMRQSFLNDIERLKKNPDPASKNLRVRIQPQPIRGLCPQHC